MKMYRGSMYAYSIGDEDFNIDCAAVDGKVGLIRHLTDEEIEDYVLSGAPLDKAGAYGIQGPAGAFVERIEGDYFTIVGLPLCRLTVMLRNTLGLTLSDLK